LILFLLFDYALSSFLNNLELRSNKRINFYRLAKKAVAGGRRGHQLQPLPQLPQERVVAGVFRGSYKILV
jgi:hypothetical protein